MAELGYVHGSDMLVGLMVEELFSTGAFKDLYHQ